MTNTYNRRQFLAQSAAAAGGVVAAGAAADLAGATPAGAVTKGGTLTVGLIAEQSKPFLPPAAHMDTSGFNYARAVYDPLCVVSSDGATVYPYLCQSLTHDGTYKNWTITMRPGVKFHDGSPCNGDAIYANMQAISASGLTGPAVNSLISGYSHTRGSNTVTIHTKYKWVTFPYTLAEQQIGFIASPDVLSLGDQLNPATHPVGTGPFVYSSWNYNSEFVVKANSQYWRKNQGYPYLAEIVFKPIPNSGLTGGGRLNALETGSVDLIIETDAPSINKMRAPSFMSKYQTMFDYPGTPVWTPSANCIMLNCKSGRPFNNANLRKGAAYAINRQLYTSVVDGGESVPVNGIFLPSSPYYKNPSYPPATGNTTTARTYVGRVPSGSRKATLLYVGGDPTIASAAEFIQGQLSAVGITITLSAVTQTALIDAAIAGDYDCMTWSQFGGVSPDLNYPWFSTVTHLNFANNLDATTQQLMLNGMAQTTAAGRETEWGAVNNRVDSDLPYLWTDRVVLGIGASSKVQGWKSFTDPAGHAVLQPNQDVFFYTGIWKS